MNDLIKQARELCEGATEGPWGVYEENDGVDIIDYCVNATPYAGICCGISSAGNAALLAASRTLVPALADALEAAGKGMDKRRQELDRINEAIKDKGGNEYAPTQDAYDAACNANKNNRIRAEQAERGRDAAVEELLRLRADYARLNDFEHSQCAKLLEEIGRLRAELEQVKAARGAAHKALHLAIANHSTDPHQIERLEKHYLMLAYTGKEED